MSILFIDEIHTVIGAGLHLVVLWMLSNLLKPALKGQLDVWLDYIQRIYKLFDKDQSFIRRFQKIDIIEP